MATLLISVKNEATGYFSLLRLSAESPMFLSADGHLTVPDAANFVVQSQMANKADLVSGVLKTEQIPSTLAPKTYVDTKITNLLNSAPANFDTLKEIADQLASDESAVSALVIVVAGKEPLIAAGTSAQYYRGDKTFQTMDKTAVGLANVNNTSDANKPVSTAQQTALDAKGGKITYYNAAGAITQPIKKWVGMVTPSTGNGYSIDISSAGFSSILGIQIIAIKNTAAATNSPNVSIKSISTSTVVVNITEGLASIVLAVGAVIFANVTGLTLYVEVTGN